jgi:hypothetical protein
MFDQLFERPHALARQLSAPLVEERRQYLSLCHSQEFPEVRYGSQPSCW